MVSANSYQLVSKTPEFSNEHVRNRNGHSTVTYTTNVTFLQSFLALLHTVVVLIKQFSGMMICVVPVFSYKVREIPK